MSTVQRHPSSDLRAVRETSRVVQQPMEPVEWVGSSPASRELQRQLRMAGVSDAPVLLEGETGVGKDLAARLVHQNSSRRDQPFVAINATSLGEALFESELFGHRKGSFSDAHQHHEGLARAADGGTLFLDEIGELSRLSQSKLLRFLDHREVRPVGSCETLAVDVRFVCATNRDLLEDVERGLFRRDLYYRLRVLSIQIPPLRDRREDIAPLVRHFCGVFCDRFEKSLETFEAEALDLLMAYDWPGNTRELANEIKRTVVLMPDSRRVGAELLSSRITSGWSSEDRARGLKQRARKLEKTLILETLDDTGWNVSAAARRLDMSRVGLAKKMRRMGIRRPERRSSAR